MFARGRPCLRRRLPVVLDTVAAGPDEPLLFLYPRWAASVLQRQQSIASLTPAAAPSKAIRTSDRSLQPPRPRASSPALRRQSSKWISTNAAGTANKRPNRLKAVAEKRGAAEQRAAEKRAAAKQERAAEEERAVNLDRGEVNNEGAGPGNGSEALAALATGPRRPVQNLAGIEVDTPNRTPPTIWKNRRRNRDILTSRFPGTSQQSISRRLRPEYRLSRRDQKKLRYGMWLKRRTGDVSLSSGNWLSLKDVLERREQGSYQGTRKSYRQRELYLPEETIGLLSGVTDAAMKENVWYIAVHNGCRVQVLHPREGDGINRKVILSGSDHVTEIVEGRFRRQQSLQSSGDPLVSMSKPLLPMFSSTDLMRRKNIPVPMVRGIWYFPKAYGKEFSVDEVIAQRSSINTVRELAEYIDDLTHARAPHLFEKVANNYRILHHHEQIAKELLYLFRQDYVQKLCSSAALNQALTFLCEHEFLRIARVVFSRAEHVATAETYNIFLRYAGRRQDIIMFRKLLVSMSRAQIRPNPETWIALLSAMVTPSAKASLMTHMVHKGLLKETSILRTSLQLTIHDSLWIHLENGQSMESFIALMYDTHGANWFSISLLSQMFAVTCRQRNFAATDALLKICFESQLPVGSETLSAVLGMCRRNISAALRYTIELLRIPGFRLSEEEFDLLFRIAYKAQRYNICRVLWRYACVYECVSYRMKLIVTSSLCRHTVRMGITREETRNWHVNAGKFIAGLEQHLPVKSPNTWYPKYVIDGLPSEFRNNALGYLLSSGFKTGAERTFQLRVASAVAQRDRLSGAYRYHAMFPLSVMLEAAEIIDNDWRTRPPMTLSEMLDEGIKVPIARRSSSLRYPKYPHGDTTQEPLLPSSPKTHSLPKLM
ncbi:hypothetical protein N7532_004517 [Penicillium argentinense]|uniref:Uncharacterized protein n=1 Tax=Penicillium argentinense TaxID=1131581 RepID=A0A9W9FPH2_9EURO|nr:uncharacterized protein N7532_004517 [Penicillium argentinense]KAJ5103988.1 hypothetical protein N7532_004517 [Penicillium argentinense]